MSTHDAGSAAPWLACTLCRSREWGHLLNAARTTRKTVRPAMSQPHGAG